MTGGLRVPLELLLEVHDRALLGVVGQPHVFGEHPDQVQAAPLLGARVRHGGLQHLLVVAVPAVDDVDAAGGG